MKPLLCMAAALAMILIEPYAQAKVSRLEITSRQTYGSFRTGEYARWDGRIVGELAPTDGTIPDLEKATRDANGKVQYVARVSLFFPVDPAAGNGALLVDVPNRGNPLANVMYNSPRGIPLPIGSAEPGTGFLYDHGYAVAEVY